MRAAFEVEGGGESLSESDDNNEGGLVLGASLGNASFYGGASVSLTTIEDSDPSFGLTVGILVGD